MSADIPVDDGIVLVTGASGYIATRIVQLLMSSGFRVRGSVRSLTDPVKIGPLLNICPGSRYPLELVEADLTCSESWDPAVQGCRYVIHVASPYPAEAPKDEREVIFPAVNGTLSVLEACRKYRVKRAVLTSSIVAVFGDYADKVPPGKVYTEEDWTRLENAKDPYIKSKVLALKATVEFMSCLPVDERFELCVLHPTLVLGPLLCGVPGTNSLILMRMLRGQVPLVPKFNIPIVDVRDVALAHVRAMVLPEANGQRIIVHSGQSVWFEDVTKLLNRQLGRLDYCISTVPCPYALAKIVILFDGTTKMFFPIWGKTYTIDNSKMKHLLKITDPIPADVSTLDNAYSLIDRGFVEMTNKYRRSRTVQSSTPVLRCNSAQPVWRTSHLPTAYAPRPGLLFSSAQSGQEFHRNCPYFIQQSRIQKFDLGGYK